MEIGAQLAQGDEEFRGQEHDEQHAAQIERRRCRAGVGVLPQGDADARRSAAIGDQIYGGQRAQLDAQHAHRHDTEALGILTHRRGGAPVGVEGLQRLQALQIVEEGRAHVGVAPPIAFEGAGGAHRHHPHNEDDQRRADQQRKGRGQVERGDHDEQRDRREHRVEQLRQEQFEATLNLLNTLAGRLHHVGGAHRGGIGGAERQHLAIQLHTQGELDATGSLGAQAGGHDGDDVANQHADDEHADIDRAVGACHHRVSDKHHTANQRDQRGHESNIGQQPNPQARHFARNQAPQPRSQPKQPFVHHNPLRSTAFHCSESQAEHTRPNCGFCYQHDEGHRGAVPFVRAAQVRGRMRGPRPSVGRRPCVC